MKLWVYLADQNPHRDTTRGITAYTEGLLSRLAAREDLEVSGLASRSSYAGPAGCRIRILPFRSDRPAGRLLADQLHPWLGTGDADLCHYPKGYLPLATRPRAPAVGTVHDTIADAWAERWPTSRGRATSAYWRAMLARSLARFDLVITVSQASRRAIEGFCERRRIRCPAVAVTGQGARWEDARPPGVKKDDAVLHLGSRLPHKGTDALLALWARLEAEDPDLPRLRVVGDLAPEQVERVRRLRHAELEPPLPGAALREALASARALLLPSEIEGFGLPALEAYYLGTPVVYRRGTALEEVLGERAPGGFEPGSPDSLRAALDEVLELPPAAVEAQAARLRARFAWARCVERTLEAYRRVA
jgi:glycosyltransferase involved in cell wall biosynthesis